MLLDQGRIIEFNQYVELPGDDEKINPIIFIDPPALFRNSNSKFYSLCKATGKEGFGMLKKMAGV